MKIQVSILRFGLILFAGSLLLSCQKSVMKDMPAPKKSASVKLTGKFSGKDGFVINGDFQFIATETKTATNYFTRQIDVVYIPSDQLVNTFVMRVDNADPNVDLYQSIAGGAFTGTFTISSGGFVFLTKQADKGADVALPNNGFDYDMALQGIPTNLDVVAGCVMKNINNADWTSYVNDMIETPDNYLWQWAGCDWKY